MARLLALLLAALLIPAGAGCLVRGDVSFIVDDPRPEAWTPADILRGALGAAGAQVNETHVLEFGATFDEEGILRILDLRFLTHEAGSGKEFYLDYLVGRPYDEAADHVEFRGFRHNELATGERPDPAKEWRIEPKWLALLDTATFATLAGNLSNVPEGQPYVLEFRLGADCVPRPVAEDVGGQWPVYNATEQGLESAGGDWELVCYARPHLPATMLVNVHTPCYKSSQCPDAQVHQHLVQYQDHA